MKIVVSLLVVIALIGAAIGDESGDPAERLVCPFPGVELPELRHKLYTRAEKCVRDTIYNSTGVELELEKNNSPTELIVTAFNTRCANRALFDQCWDGARIVANSCFDATGITKFSLYRKYRDLDFELNCVDNGQNAAKMFEANIMKGFRIHVDCAINATDDVEQPTADDQDLNADMIYEYKLVNKVLECLDGHKDGEDGVIVNMYIAFGTGIKDNMKCLKEGADVLCKTIVENN